MEYREMLAALRERRNNDWAIRIVTECTYLEKLFVARGEDPPALFIKAVEKLYAGCEAAGAITQQDCLAAEKELCSLEPLAKQLTVHMVAHAHIDMNWFWTYGETVNTVIDTFRTMLDLLEEFPSYVFSQSQASAYRMIEEYAPAMLPEIRKYVQQGRWEVTAATWVEADRNLPSGESEVRHLLYTRRYLKKLLGLTDQDFVIDFEPDTFGHNGQVPELLQNAGVRFYYHCRGKAGKSFLYRWQGQSGASVVAYDDPFWYGSVVDHTMLEYAPDMFAATKLPIMLKMYGVGDHGGGPTRRDIKRILTYASWPLGPQVRMGRLRDYFLEAEKHDLPVETGERNFIFQGCYSSQTRIKMANRRGEQALYEAEMLAAFARAQGKEIFSSFEKAWEPLLFNQFHDILSGSGALVTREYAMGVFQQAMAGAGTVASAAMRELASQINTESIITPDYDQDYATGGGAGSLVTPFGYSVPERGRGKVRIFHVFNTSNQERNELLDLVAWDWPGETGRIRVENAAGEPLPWQLLVHEKNAQFYHNSLRLAVKARIPALGYTTVVLKEGPAQAPGLLSPSPYFKEDSLPSFVLENSRIKAVFHTQTMELVSLLDKNTGRELVSGPTAHLLYSWEQHNDMSSWRVGKIKSREVLNRTQEVTVTDRNLGGLRQWLKYRVPFAAPRAHALSYAEVRVVLEEGSNRLNFEIAYDFLEVGNAQLGTPRLDFACSLSDAFAQAIYDQPFGMVSRPASLEEMPGLSYIAAKQDAGYALLLADTRYGFVGDGQAMSVCLVRGSYNPDPHPELCHGAVRLGLVFAGQITPEAERFNLPLSFTGGLPHAGKLKPEGSFIKVEGMAALCAIKPAEGKGLAVRLYGKEDDTISVSMPGLRRAYLADLHENPVTELAGNPFTIGVKKDKLYTLLLETE